MTRSKLPALFLFTCFFSGTALTGQNYFQKTYDTGLADEGMGIEILPNGDILTAGVSAITDPFTLESVWIQRLNAQGTVLWSKIISGGNRIVGADVQRALTGDGFWVIYNTYPGNFGAVEGGWMKISENGDVLLSRKVSPPTVFKRMLPLSDGGLLLTGYDDPNGWLNAVAMKINANGDVVWKTGFGNSTDDILENCWEDAQGFIYCCGYTSSINDLDHDGLLAKISPSGQLLWTRQYGGAGEDVFTGIAPFVSDTSLMLAGYTTSFGSTDKRVWLTKVTSSGTVKWSRIYTTSNLELGATDVLALAGDQFVVSASDPDYQAGSPAILFKTSADGDLLWEYLYRAGGAREILREVLPTTGGFVAVGSAAFDDDETLYVLKVASDGLIPGSDCCPAPAGLTVTDVMPETETFTLPAFHDFNTAIYPLNADDQFPVETDICTFIDLAFSVSDSSICPGECVDITVTGNTPGVTYSFETPGGVPDPGNPLRICYPSEGDFLITRKGQNSVCTRDLSIKIEVGNRADAFPNAFTPNGDGVNDTFKPLFLCPVVTTDFKIYNRWGKKVFETKDPAKGWDGKIDGSEAASDVYVWQVEYEVVRDGQPQKFMEKGDVALLR